MGTYDYYASMANNLNNPNASLDEIKGWFEANPINHPDWKPTYVDVTKPTLKSNEQLLDEFGLAKDKYSLKAMQKTLDEQSYKAYDGLTSSLYEARHSANVSAAESYRSLSDTINAKYSQGIDLGINRAMNQTNLLSTMLGTSQHNQRTIQNIDNQLGSSQAKLKESLVGNEQAAHDSYDNLYDYLSKTAEQLYKEDIKRQEAEEKYNSKIASVAKNYEIDKNYADFIYSSTVEGLAQNIYNSNQAKKTLISKAASAAASADKLAERYKERAHANAAAAIASASANAWNYAVTTTKLEGVEKVLSGYFNRNNSYSYEELVKFLDSINI